MGLKSRDAGPLEGELAEMALIFKEIYQSGNFTSSESYTASQFKAVPNPELAMRLDLAIRFISALDFVFRPEVVTEENALYMEEDFTRIEGPNDKPMEIFFRERYAYPVRDTIICYVLSNDCFRTIKT